LGCLKRNRSGQQRGCKKVKGLGGDGDMGFSACGRKKRGRSERDVQEKRELLQA